MSRERHAPAPEPPTVARDGGIFRGTPRAGDILLAGARIFCRACGAKPAVTVPTTPESRTGDRCVDCCGDGDGYWMFVVRRRDEGDDVRRRDEGDDVRRRGAADAASAGGRPRGRSRDRADASRIIPAFRHRQQCSGAGCYRQATKPHPEHNPRRFTHCGDHAPTRSTEGTPICYVKNCAEPALYGEPGGVLAHCYHHRRPHEVRVEPGPCVVPGCKRAALRRLVARYFCDQCALDALLEIRARPQPRKSPRESPRESPRAQTQARARSRSRARTRSRSPEEGELRPSPRPPHNRGSCSPPKKRPHREEQARPLREERPRLRAAAPQSPEEGEIPRGATPPSPHSSARRSASGAPTPESPRKSADPEDADSLAGDRIDAIVDAVLAGSGAAESDAAEPDAAESDAAGRATRHLCARCGCRPATHGTPRRWGDPVCADHDPGDGSVSPFVAPGCVAPGCCATATRGTAVCPRLVCDFHAAAVDQDLVTAPSQARCRALVRRGVDGTGNGSGSSAGAPGGSLCGAPAELFVRRAYLCAFCAGTAPGVHGAMSAARFVRGAAASLGLA